MAELSRIEGCLLGLMVGDSVGLPREGLSGRRARRIFGPEIGQQLVFGHGMISDDTEHACMTAQALLRYPANVENFSHSLAWKLRFWLLGAPAGIGWATLRSIIKLWAGCDPGSSGVMSAGNGAAMRSPVIGIFFDAGSKRAEFVAACTRLTHREPRAERGALAVAEAAQYAGARSQDSFLADELLDRLAKIFPDDDAEARRWIKTVRRGVSEAWDGPRFASELGCEDGISGYIYHTLPAVLWAWLGCPFDFRETLTRVISLGGDTDTTGAIAGALCGSACGGEKIPNDWIERIWDFPRSVAWVKGLAGRLKARQEGADVGPGGLLWPAILPRNAVFAAVILLHAAFRPLSLVLPDPGP